MKILLCKWHTYSDKKIFYNFFLLLKKRDMAGNSWQSQCILRIFEVSFFYKNVKIHHRLQLRSRTCLFSLPWKIFLSKEHCILPPKAFQSTFTCALVFQTDKKEKNGILLRKNELRESEKNFQHLKEKLSSLS